MKLSKNNLFIKAWQFAKGDAYEYPTNWCSLTWFGLLGILMLTISAVPGLIYLGVIYIVALISGGEKPDWEDFYCTKPLFWIAVLHGLISTVLAMIVLKESESAVTMTFFLYTFFIFFFSFMVGIFLTIGLAYFFSDWLPKKLNISGARFGKLGEGAQAAWHGMKKLKDDYCPLIEYENEKK